MNREVIYDISVSDFQYLRDRVKWNKLDDNQVYKALNNSMFNVSVKIDDKVIGVGRIVGDKCLKGMLTDIMVDPDYQGLGIGKLIVTSLIDKLDSYVGVGEAFQLEASPTANNREFYIKCGLNYKPENQDGVYMWIRK